MSQQLVNEGLINTLREFAELGEEVAGQVRIKAQRLKSMNDTGAMDTDMVDDTIERLGRIAAMGTHLSSLVESLALESGFAPVTQEADYQSVVIAA